MGATSDTSDREHIAAVYSCIGSFCYAACGAIAHSLGSRCSWELLSVVRGVSMMIFAAAAMALAGLKPVVWNRSLWIRSFAGCATTFCSFYAWTRLPLADVTTLINTVPIWVALLSGLFLKERTGLGVWVAVLMAFGGVVLIQRPHLQGDYSGVLAALGAGLAGSFSVVGLRQAKHLDARQVVLHMSTVVSGVTLAVFWLRGAEAFPGSGAAEQDVTMWGMIGLLGLFTALSQYTITRAYALGRASRVTVLGVLGVVFAAGFDRILWQRHFSSGTLLGMLLVTAPSIWLTTRAARDAWKDRARIIAEPETPGLLVEPTES